MASTVDSKRVSEFDEEKTPGFSKKLDELASLVKKSRYTVFYTGAGVSTSAGVGDYRGPSGAWTNRKIKELERNSRRTQEEEAELIALKKEAAKEIQKANKKVDMCDAQPTLTHMAQATLIRLGIAHYVVTTNLDGIYRKAGLKGHTQLCCLHGDIYVERCSGCGFDFERNYHTRQDEIHVHDHRIGKCSKCGSDAPSNYTGTPGNAKMKHSCWGGRMIGTRDKNMGTKDTHINFGECLDSVDWDEADTHCGKADLCIIAGTSMSLRHITHFPFMAKKVVLINLQATPDDNEAHLRIWAKCDPVFEGLMERLGHEIDPIPVWRPEHSVPINKIPKNVHPYYVKKAQGIEEMIKLRELEAQDRKKEQAEKDALNQKLKILSLDKKDEKQLVIGNKHQKVKSDDQNTHDWTMFVQLSDKLQSQGAKIEDVIESVTYGLHPTFVPPSVKISKAPFELNRLGWGTFEVNVTINFQPELKLCPMTVKHTLDFTKPETSSTYPLMEKK